MNLVCLTCWTAYAPLWLNCSRKRRLTIDNTQLICLLTCRAAPSFSFVMMRIVHSYSVHTMDHFECYRELQSTSHSTSTGDKTLFRLIVWSQPSWIWALVAGRKHNLWPLTHATCLLPRHLHNRHLASGHISHQPLPSRVLCLFAQPAKGGARLVVGLEQASIAVFTPSPSRHMLEEHPYISTLVSSPDSMSGGMQE